MHAFLEDLDFRRNNQDLQEKSNEFNLIWSDMNERSFETIIKKIFLIQLHKSRVTYSNVALFTS